MMKILGQEKDHDALTKKSKHLKSKHQAKPTTEFTKMTNFANPKEMEVQSFDEYKAIKDGVMPYIEGSREADGKLAITAFYDHAHIVGTIGGKLDNADTTAFAAAVSGLPKSPTLEYNFAMIDVSGPAATVKLEFKNYAGFRFTDYLVMFKQEGKWKISGKTYNSHSNN